jgi:hypothetical protein
LISAFEYTQISQNACNVGAQLVALIASRCHEFLQDLSKFKGIGTAPVSKCGTAFARVTIDPRSQHPVHGDTFRRPALPNTLSQPREEPPSPQVQIRD